MGNPWGIGGLGGGGKSPILSKSSKKGQRISNRRNRGKNGKMIFITENGLKFIRFLGCRCHMFLAVGIGNPIFCLFLI